MWKCKNCGKTFPIAGRISFERRPSSPMSVVPMGDTRIIVEKPCCPFCESIEFEEVK